MKIFTGKVIHSKLEKTAAVAVEQIIPHPVYKKRLKRTRKYLVHDELGAETGDTVRFVASRPFSKKKRWQIIEVVGRKLTKIQDKDEKITKRNSTRKSKIKVQRSKSKTKK